MVQIEYNNNKISIMIKMLNQDIGIGVVVGAEVTVSVVETGGVEGGG